MEKKSPPSVSRENNCKVQGTVRTQQQPIPALIVQVYNIGMRARRMLGEAITDASGGYTISYPLEKKEISSISVCVYDKNKTLLKESKVQNQVSTSMQVDIELSETQFRGISSFEQLVNDVIPFIEDVPLSQLTENDTHHDISYISQKTRLSQDRIEKLAMASRLETLTSITASIWYAMLLENMANPGINTFLNHGITSDFETRLETSLDVLMHSPVDTLMDSVKKAADENIIDNSVIKDLNKIRKQLNSQILAYAKQHPVSGSPSILFQKAVLGGLKGEEIQSFLEKYTGYSGSKDDFWDLAKKDSTIKSNKNLDQLQAVFQLSELTGNNLALTENLIKSNGIKSVADIKKLAAFGRKDWEALVKENKIASQTVTTAKTQAESTQNYAAQLEANFVAAFPTTNFAAKLGKDTQSKLPHRDKISKFLQENENFDLLHDHVGKFIKENEKTVPAEDAMELADHLRRIQRVFKLAPNYETSNLLLNDKIHSAQQVHKMGKDNFIRKYGSKLGEREATEIFQRASQVHDNALALMGNLKSLADASAMNAFPDFKSSLDSQLTHIIPNLDTLFGHSDFCECSECSSVYGAPAYLTDILHFLDSRNTTLQATDWGDITKIPSVKDMLLRRRPDIGEIDLECNNTNTEVPYIDIACEIMEDYIATPVISLQLAFLINLVKGPINPSLLTELINRFNAAGMENISSLLSTNATLSETYEVNVLQPDNTYLTTQNTLIRDSQITLRASTGASGIEVRVLHQTLLPSETISAGPEYINTNVYTNFLKSAKSPFTLPFDLFETEGELYLEKLGAKKADLISIFRKKSTLPAGTSPDDLGMAYAGLGINEAEQTLIFVSDPTHQSLYWGSFATATAIQVDIFEKLTGLNYAQVLNLLQLQFINPAKDITIEHDSVDGTISLDRTMQRVTNLTADKLDAIHRFLRLWRKTTLTMDELDAIISGTGLGQGKIDAKLAWLLRHFILLQQTLQLDAFPLMAFYQPLDKSLHDQLFQNREITNPVNPVFSIPSIQAHTVAMGDPEKLIVCAALQISKDELNTLLTKTNTSPEISFNTLSMIYRVVQLSRSLEISIADLCNLLNLIDVYPFADTAATYLFLQKYKLLLSSGISIDELNYLLRHQDNSAHLLIPSINQVTTSLVQLQDELLTVRAVTQPAVDTNGVLLNKWLIDPVFKWDNNLLNKLVEILNTADDDDYKQKISDNYNFLLNLRLLYHDTVLVADLPGLPLASADTPIIFPSSISEQLTYDADKKQLRLVGYMSQADRDLLKTLPAGPPTEANTVIYLTAIDSLFNQAQQTISNAENIFFASIAEIDANLKSILNTSTADRFALFITKLSPVYRKLKQQDTLVKDISTWFKVDKKIVNQLLVLLPAIYTDFTDDNFVNKIVVSNVVQANRYQFVAKICFIAGKLKLTDTDLAFLLPNATSIGSLDLLNLPLTPVNTTINTFAGYESMINLLKFQQFYPAKVLDTPTTTTISIYTILLEAISQGTLTSDQLAAYIANLVSSLALLTGWKTNDMNALINAPNFLALTLPADIKSIPVLIQLHKCFIILNQTGASAADAVTWCKASLSFVDSEKIKQTLKSKYTNSDWLQVTKPLQDKLREMKRDALITYLLANPGTQSWKEPDDLFNYFLLDVEMCSCQPTSRIVLATNSVQLFVQRCFLNLEDFIMINSKTDSNWLQWKWMKNFRVWQANVKVFLYPENWIEPELLPDEIKSPFLKELEDSLLQNEVTETAVEDAFQSYLVKLDGIAQLEIKGMWYDDGTNTLHVIGRTYGGNPKIYYYRRLIDNRRWTPWLKVDLEINSEHIVPVVYNNRFYLFWSVITEVADADQATPIPKSTDASFTLPQPKKSWQIQLAFSEYKNGKWTPKKISENDFTGQLVFSQDGVASTSQFVFLPLDMPLFDYENIFDQNGVPKDSKPVFDQKASAAVSQNGTLLINCYYYKLIDTTKNFGNCTPLGTFQLDIVKGYPVLSSGGYNVLLSQSQDTSTMVNMLDTENLGRRHHQHVNFIAPDQSKGAFRNLIPMQMGMIDRINFLQTLYQFGNTNNVLNNQLSMAVFLPRFYQDNLRTYFVEYELGDNGKVEFLYPQFLKFWKIRLEVGNDAAAAYLNSQIAEAKGPIAELYHYFNFHHPHVNFFIKQLFSNGIDSLMDRETQLKGDFAYDPSQGKFSFQDYMQPAANVYSGSLAPITYPNGVTDTTPGYPKDDVDFDILSGYGSYNWELFFHAPLMIAERLSLNQKFDDADRWYKYIFNPMDISDKPSPDKYWNTKPFFINANNKYFQQRIDNILKGINGGATDLVQNVDDWRNNPFQPHFIAQYRTVAYQKVAVMKYIGHLIRHGDFLFSQDTMESVNEATQLYILAAEILGPKPEVIPSAGITAVDNYYQLEQKLDALSDAMVDIENLMPLQSVKGYTGITPNTPDKPTLRTLYFCIPMNENMAGPTGYWDTVADRLFKIRHCLNIDGTVAPLSLFAPVIDPGMLVRAAAAGLDIGSVLNDTNSPLPLYRFMVMLQKANELCNEVKLLGNTLLSALEKKDAETMALLRSSHEIKLLGAVLTLKQKQKDDAQSVLDNLGKQKELITIRQKYYSGLINEGLTDSEIAALALNSLSALLEIGVGVGNVLSGGLKIIPTVVLGASGLGSPVVTASIGGTQVGGAAEMAVKAMMSAATLADKSASIINTNNNYNRRAAEWQFQLDLANKELEQIEVQLSGARIRLDIATKDAENQQLQIDQANEADDFMHSKFTNEELLNWMVTQVSGTYFKSYQLAYDIAKQTERCFRYELGIEDSSYINFGYWDSLKKGLLSGEQLFYDIKRMEMAYFEQNKRELELTKHISVSQLDAVALLKLKTTEECWINLPEELFDIDYPGHYMRRIKSVSVTIPCITGPYTTVSCKLTMTKNSVRTSGISTSDANQYARKTSSNGFPADDPRFRDSVGALQSIATSSAQNDSGLFELNFHDERYLPFEGAGAISMWHLQLPAAIRQFDYNTISDVIIHLKYTARDGGETLKTNASDSIASKISKMLVSSKDTGLTRIFSAKNDLPTEWYRFLHPVNDTDDQVLTVNIDNSRFPFFVQGMKIKITAIELIADSTVTPLVPISNILISPFPPPPAPASYSLTATNIYGNWLSVLINYGENNKQDPGTWIIKNPGTNARLTDSSIDNLVIIVHYEVS